MGIEKKHKLTLSVVLVLAVIGGLIYFLGIRNTPPNFTYDQKLPPGFDPVIPYKPLVSSGTENKKVSFDGKLPPDFPGGVILEDKSLESSVALYTGTNKVQTVVTYISDKTLPELVTLYKNNFTNNGWSISGNKATDFYTAFDAKKGDTKVHLIISLTQVESQRRVEFSYEK